ncbi:propionate CoA-transferase [Leisingera sp. ANG-M1]|uniref:CoA-transferase n=1 Tax=Leisingera sp. ANG-M1 TaxID=1577895 RepID=UPI00057E82BC|nr:CoA-transferase [Leisingera sp. ANG-M1]KIC07692.1 propionate CoA-transferase [Leisingera sp. ANG-M1]
MTKLCSLEEALSVIKDEDSVVSTGVIGWITPDALLKGVADKFEATAHPKDLTFYFPCGTGDAMHIGGMDHVAKKGLMKRIIGGSYLNPIHPDTGERPKLMQLIHADEVEAYSWPIATTMLWLREVARGTPGYMTKTGIGTYVDPDNQGGRFTPSAKEDLVEKINFRGEDYLFYPARPLQVAFLRATSADENGNLSFENEALQSSNLGIAIAVKASGGTVIAQVERKVPLGSRKVSDVCIPGSLVDKVVIVQDQKFVTNIDKPDPAYLGGNPVDPKNLPKPAPGADKIIARRASMEVRKKELSIFGFGASGDVPLVMAEDGKFDGGQIYDYEFTTEHGSYGGVVMSGWQFSANINPEALIDGLYQFDVIEGGLCKFAALAFAEFDQSSTVNVSKFGKVNPGSGGFVNIAHNAERVIFTGTFTTAGLKTAVQDGQLSIMREGKVKKFVQTAQHITYLVREGVLERGQTAKLITERAVFEVTADGLELVEIAPGIDLQRDVLDQMEFAPSRIVDPLPLMDAALFAENYEE